MIANVLLLFNLLNELGIRDQMWDLQSILSLFLNGIDRFNYTGAWVFNSISQYTKTTLKSCK